MTPCFSAVVASMRQASTTMSWVAPAKAVITAKAAISPRLVAGSTPAIIHRPTITTAWQTSIHERRWPSHLVSTGSCVRSSSGAQTNLKE